jgi:RNA polymerase sigma-70 factor (ECF subfamily)
VSTLAVTRERYDVDAVVAAATAGDESAFSELVARYRHELQAHAYRMLGSYEESEDLTQETFLRAWHKRESLRSNSSFRAWLYRIATNVCLTALDRRPPRPRTGDRIEVDLMPHLDRALEVIPTDGGYDAEVVTKETIELAFLAAVRYLPPKQRAVLFVRDLLAWPAKDTAALLGTTVSSVNSALQRARGTLRRHLAEHRLEWAPVWAPTAEERALLSRCLEAVERGNAPALAAMAHEQRTGGQHGQRR